MALNSLDQSRVRHQDTALLEQQADDPANDLEENSDVVRTKSGIIKFATDQTAELSMQGLRDILGSEQQQLILTAEDIAAVRKEVGLFDRFRKITAETRECLERFKKKLSALLSRAENNDVIGETENIARPVYEAFREGLGRHQKEISKPVITEARLKREQLLEKRGLFSLSKEEFDTYFASDFDTIPQLQQQNVGDCYAVAAIHAMSCSPNFEMICRSSMKRLPDGSWQVKIPLMSDVGKMITITQSEISPQRNPEFLKRGEGGQLMPDLRPRLQPLKGKEGLRVLEAAFIKEKFGSVDRLAAEGGHADDVLLKFGGENFQRYRLDSNTYDYEKEKWDSPGLETLDEEDMAYLDHFLENFDPEIYVATAATKIKKAGSMGVYKVKGAFKFLVYSHAYSISNVDNQKKIVTMANPWNTAKPIHFTFDQFKKSFSVFRAIKVDSASLLLNMKGVEAKKTQI